MTHHHSHYSAAHPTHPGHSLVGSLVGAASRGYPTPAGGPVAALHHTHAPPPPVHTTDYTAHHQLSQQVNLMDTWKNYNWTQFELIHVQFILFIISLF